MNYLDSVAVSKDLNLQVKATITTEFKLPTHSFLTKSLIIKSFMHNEATIMY